MERVLDRFNNSDILSEQDPEKYTKYAQNPQDFIRALRESLRFRLDRLSEERRRLKNSKEIENKKERIGSIEAEITNTEEDVALLERVEDFIKNKSVEEVTTESTAVELKQTVNRAQHRLSEIEQKQNKIENLDGELAKKVERVEQLESTAESLLERTTSGALGEEFADRKTEIENNLRWWKAASVLSILALLGSAIVLYADIRTGNTGALVSVSKLALVLPVSVAVWFSVSNYSRRKKLMEEYEFKARMALSLDAFREVLRDEVTEENEEEVAQFVTSTMEKIYSNPQQNIGGLGGQGEQAADTPPAQGPLVDLISRNQ